MRDALKVMPPVLLCWPTSEADGGGIAVGVETSWQYPTIFYCHVLNSSMWKKWHPLTFIDACWTFMEPSSECEHGEGWVVCLREMLSQQLTSPQLCLLYLTQLPLRALLVLSTSPPLGSQHSSSFFSQCKFSQSHACSTCSITLVLSIRLTPVQSH